MMNVVPVEAANAAPSSALTGTDNHTYLLVSRASALLVDAGVGHRDHLKNLAAALRANDASLATVVVTHDHADHISGAPAIAGAFPSTGFAKYPSNATASRPPAGWRALLDNEAIEFGDEAIVVVHTPGHSPDHIVLWYERTGALFGGDLVIAGSSVMIPASRGGRLIEYLQSLQRVLALAPQRIYPAHGPVIDDPPAVISAYLEHRRQRERQVLAALGEGRRTVEAIAESIYDDLDPRLLPAARDTVLAHLEKLKAEGIADNLDGWRAV
jgi:glyoxylase-like metal-dependent hydrolase (beta-lactamase superfamily II)